MEVGGEDLKPTANCIFPNDLKGKSVLDIGCHYGYYCHEAKRRGAGKVLGVELNPPLYIIEKLNEQNKSLTKIPSLLIAEYLGLELNYVNSLRKEIKSIIIDARKYFN